MNDIDHLLIGEAALHGLVREHMTWTSKCLGDGAHQSWAPALAVKVKDSPDDEGGIMMCVLSVPFNEREEKHAVMRNMGRMVYQAEKIPVAVVLSSECWMSTRRNGPKTPHCEPRHDPARQEGIVVFGATMGIKHAAVAFAQVERDADGNMKVAPFEEISKSEPSPLLQSFFLGFFETTARKMGVVMP